MTSGELVGIVARSLTAHASELSSWSECQIQLCINHALLGGGRMAVREYPYPDNGECDVVVTEPADWRAVTDWIEVKPLVPGSEYWYPAKLIVGEYFKHDIRKLASQAGRRWFCLVMLTEHSVIDAAAFLNPVERRKMTPEQLISVVSHLACGRPAIAPPFPSGELFCHCFVWSVTRCSDMAIERRGGEYPLQLADG